MLIFLFILLHYRVFQSSWGHPEGGTDTFRELGQQNTCIYVNIRLKNASIVPEDSRLRAETCSSVNRGVLTCIVGFLLKIVTSVEE